MVLNIALFFYYFSTEITVGDKENNIVSGQTIVASAMSIDNTICRCLCHPSKADRFKINKYIKHYIIEIEKIVIKLMSEGPPTEEEIKGFIKTGAARFITMPVQIDDLDENFHWDEKQLKEFKNLREATRDVWMKVNMLSSENPHFNE